MKQRLIIGCGYLGERVARRWVAQGDVVCALTRSAARARRLAELGIDPVIGDVMEPASLTALPEADSCLYAVGFDRIGGYDKRAVYVTGLRNLLQSSAGKISRLIAISSTSVYGQDAGEWVNEESQCAPTTEGGRICLEAEDVVRDWLSAGNVMRPVRGTILRLSGIYGPGRLIGRVDQLRRQEPLAVPPDSWLNLIHVDDAALAVCRLAEAEYPSELLLLSDERPLPRREFYSELARLLNAPAPLFSVTADPSLNKRCDSFRIRRELSLALRYPSVFDGLPPSLGNSGESDG